MRTNNLKGGLVGFMAYPLHRDLTKTTGGYVKGIALDAIVTEEYKRAYYQGKKARKEEHMKVLSDFIDFFTDRMKNVHPLAAQEIEKSLFDNWKQNRVAKALPQANIQIENLLKKLNMYDAADVARALYQEFRETRL